jgi:uncharacterized protein YkwD
MKRFSALLAVVATLGSFGTPGVAASEEGTVRLSFIRPVPIRASIGQARALFADVNAERVRQGLPALEHDARLDQFALALARQMVARRYFGHTDPGGVTFQDRLRVAGLLDRFMAENIAFDQDEVHAHQAFLHSPGHYANIVDRAPRKLGIAVLVAGEGEVFFVEEFSD